jgi:hypothetical protein
MEVAAVQLHSLADGVTEKLPFPPAPEIVVLVLLREYEHWAPNWLTVYACAPWKIVPVRGFTEVFG